MQHHDMDLSIFGKLRKQKRAQNLETNCSLGSVVAERSVVEHWTPEREVWGSKPISAMLCP